MVLKTASLVSSFLAHLLIGIIVGLRPLLGPATCKYPVSCTEFARQTLLSTPLPQAVFSIIIRVVSCIGYSPSSFK